MIIGHTFQPVCQQKNSNFLQKKGSTFFVFPSKMPFLNLMTLGRRGPYFFKNGSVSVYSKKDEKKLDCKTKSH